MHRRIVALRSSGRFGIPRLLDAVEGVDATRGGHSFLEREYLRLLSGAGLPLPTTQAVLTRAGDHLVRVDFRFEGTPVVVEVLGYHSHHTKEQLRRDTERMNALLADGSARTSSPTTTWCRIPVTCLLSLGARLAAYL